LPLDYPGAANASFSPFTFMGLNYNPVRRNKAAAALEPSALDSSARALPPT
jgi:hypothetical protein